ncbi:M48 family metalloprotease [Niveibacterium sp. SC-1]|uniref:M48 family metalloprotease n=1 Tax=Niveibacterium sp. SC-1 TaxID=3135646 RepID=UPI00311F3248
MKRLLAGLLALCIAFRAFADGLPDLGDSAQADISPQMERSIAQAIIREIRFNEPSYLDDPEIEDYLDRIGARLVSTSQNPSQSFRFFVLKDGTINAASMLGGVLVFNTGLFMAADSESELASVMAHEISHTQQRHQARMMAQQRQLGYATIASMLLALVAASAGGSSNAALAAAVGGQAVAQAASLSYSRDYEREADRMGVQMLNNAGFDNRGMVTFFERLERATRLVDNNAYAYLRTHPLTTERISDMENRVQQMPFRQVVDSIDFALIKAKIDAMDKDPNEILGRFAGEPPQRPLASAVHWYARARAHLRLRDEAGAEKDLEALRKLPLASPMVDLLAADVHRAGGDARGAADELREARGRYPQSRALRYAEMDARTAAGQYQVLEQIASQSARLDPLDDKAWGYLAQAASRRGEQLMQHRAQAEVYYLRGALGAAVEQLQLGLRAGDGDFYEKSAAEARLADLRQQRTEQQKARNR